MYLVAATTATSATAAWPGSRATSQRSGVGSVAAHVSGPLRQIFFAQPLASGVEGALSSPVLGAATLVYADVCGGVHMYSTAPAAAAAVAAVKAAVEPAAAPLWSFATGAGCGGGFSAALSGSDVVIAVAGGAGVFALRADTGALLWQYTEAPDLAFRGEPLIVAARGFVSVATNDPVSPVYHLNLTTGDLVMTTSFDDSAVCLASNLALGSWEGVDYAFYTACGVDDAANLMLRIHLDTGAADSADGFGSTGTHAPIFVADASRDPVHAIAYDLSDGVLGGVFAGTFASVGACACGSEDFAGMALAASPAGRPDLFPPLFAASNPATATVAFFSPPPPPLLLQGGTAAARLPLCALNASVVLTVAGGRPARLTDALPTVDARGRVFLADQCGNLFMVERTAGGDNATSTLLWTSPSGQPVFGEVTIDATGALFFADYAGAIYGVIGGAYSL